MIRLSLRPWQRAAPFVRSPGSVPRKANVVVIGAGLAGLCTALFLHERGHDVVVLDKGPLGGEQSRRAFGWVYANGWHPEKLELALRSRALWAGFSERLGRDVGFRQSGNLTIVDSAADLEAQEHWLNEARQAAPGIDAQIIEGRALETLVPDASRSWRAGVWQPGDGTIEPEWTMAQLVQGIETLGVRMVSSCAVQKIERAGGAVSGVLTEKGPIDARTVVVAGGVWTTKLVRALGVSLPQLGIASSMQVLSAGQGPLAGAGFGPDFVWRRQNDGRYAVGTLSHTAFVTPDTLRFIRDFLPSLKETRDMMEIGLGADFWTRLDPLRQRDLCGRVDVKALDESRAALGRAFPDLARARREDQWAGIIDAVPDSTPTVGPVPNVSGLAVITGFSGNGLSNAPAAAEMLAEIIDGATPTCDPRIYRPERFATSEPFVFRH